MNYATRFTPRGWNLVLTGDASHDRLDFTSPVQWIQIVNRQVSSGYIRVKLNNDDNAVFYLYAGESQSFKADELTITSVAFQIMSSGSGGEEVDIIVGYAS